MLKVQSAIALIGFCILLTSNTHSHADQRSTLAKASREWGLHNGTDIGTVLNPFVGSLSNEVRQTTALLRNLVQQLAGEEFSRSRKPWTVTIYSNPVPYAFAAQTKLPRALHPYLGMPVGRSGQVIEIGITTGMLSLVDTVDELAFVLSHEIAHMLERHVLTKTGGSPQQEIVADYLGMQRIAGKFSLDAPVSILSKLATLNAMSSQTASDIIATNHHEGPRIALAQGFSEQLRRSAVENQISSNQPLPQYAKIRATLRPSTPETSTNYARHQRAFIKWVTTGALDDSAIQSLVATEYMPWPTLITALERPIDEGPSDIQLKQTLMDAIAALNSSSLTGHQKVTAYLRLLFYLQTLEDYGGRETSLWERLNDQEIRMIKLFLSKNSDGQDGWKASLFLKQSRQAIGRNPESVAHFFKVLTKALFTSAPHIQTAIVSDVMKLKPVEWTQFLKLYTRQMVRDRGKISIKKLNDYVVALAKRDKRPSVLSINNYSFHGPLNPILQDNLIQYIRAVQPSSWTRHLTSTGEDRGEFDFPDIRTFLDLALGDLAKNDNLDREFLLKVRDEFGRIDRDFVVWRDWLALDFFQRNSFADATYTKNFVSSFLNSLRSYPIDPSNREAIGLAFARFAEIHAVRQPVAGSDGFMSTVEHFDFIAEILKNTEIRSSRRAFVFRQMLSQMPQSRSQLETKISESARAVFYDYLSRGGVLGLIDIMKHPLPSILTQFDIILRKYFQVSTSDPKWIEKYIAARRAKGMPDFVDPAEGDLLASLPTLYVNSRLSALTLLAADPIRAAQLTASMNRQQFDQILDQIDDAIVTIANLDRMHSVSPSVSELLFRIFLRLQDHYQNPTEWIQFYKRILNRNKVGLFLNRELTLQIRALLKQRLDLLSPDELYKNLQNPDIVKTLGNDQIAELATNYIRSRVKLSNRRAVIAEIRRVNDTLKLKKSFPEAYSIFIQTLAEEANLQPADLAKLPKDELQGSKTVSRQTERYSQPIAGLAHMVAIVWKRERKEQVEFIEYLAGHRESPPAFVLTEKLPAENVNKALSFRNAVTQLKEQMQKESQITRTMTINSFLAGPNSAFASQEGEAELIQHLIREVRSEHQGLARLMANAILHAQGTSRSLVFAYLFESNSEPSGQDQLENEAQILFTLFNAFGVAGIKLGQYLGFTDQLAQYSQIMEVLQDDATPLTYFQAIQLLNTRFGRDWPKNYRVVRILGGGSVNVAIEVEDLATRTILVATVARDHIESSTEEDFRKLQLALEYVSRDPSLGQDLSFVSGLLSIIHQSVALEFDKEHAFRMQKLAEGYYNTDVNGWKVRTVEAFGQTNMTVFMAKASGKTARKVLKENPQAYKSAMAALSEVEWNVLMGMPAGQLDVMVSMFANPDFHDGQVLIDVATKTVTILDFGQAVPISNAERQTALEILKIVSQSQSARQSVKILNQWLQDSNGRPISEGELENLLSSGNRMNSFTRLLAELGLRGYTPPLASVHWVLGINRMLALSEKIGGNNLVKLKVLLIAQKFGVDLSTVNQGRRILERIRSGIDTLSCQDIFGP